jgi:hypothetical protein
MTRGSIFGSIKSKFATPNKSSAAELDGSVSPRSNLGIDSPATRRPARPGMNAFTTPSNDRSEPPPAYTPAAAAPVRGVSASPGASTADDPYAFLSSFDTVFLIDDSGSMAGRSWRETAAALETITPICVAHDVSVYF